jgi:prepilin-type N-terminal cleavage/methylation domain-containing protein
MSSSRLRYRRGFTLLELLVVIAIVSMLVALMLSAVQKVRQAAVALACKNHLKNIMLATTHAHDTHNRLPPLFGVYGGRPIASGGLPLPTGTPYEATVFYHLLPYLEEENVHANLPPWFDFRWFNIAFPVDASAGVSAGSDLANASARAIIPVFHCPSERSGGTSGWWRDQDGKAWEISNYAANWLIFGAPGAPSRLAAFAGAARLPGSVPDGLSNTIFFTEKYAVCRTDELLAGGGSLWAHPPVFPSPFITYGAAVGFTPAMKDVPNFAYLDLFQPQPRSGHCNPYQAQTPHAGGIHVALGDGSVRVVHPHVTLATWQAAFTPNGGELLGPDWDN